MNKTNYAGIPDKYSRLDDAKVVLIPVPFNNALKTEEEKEAGFKALIEASEKMELYDIETRSEVYKKGIYVAPAVSDSQESGSLEKMVETVYKTTKNYIQQEKFVSLFGGERAISIGAIKAFQESFPELTVVQLDAQANLRPEHEDSSCNSACALHEASKNTNLVQVGIRAMDASEVDYMDENQVYFAHDLYDEWQDDAIGQMTPNVFITIDVDAFDPSILPATNSPEPGGLFWYETMEFLKLMFKKKNVVGFDIVGLHPNKTDKTSDALVAKLYYKMLSYKFKYQDYKQEDDEE